MPRSAKIAHLPTTPGRPRAQRAEPGDIRELFSFQLQRLAALSTRIAALAIRPKFGITPREWRAIAVLSYLNEAPLQVLAKHSGLLKSQMSRTVSILIERGLIQRSSNPDDGRSVLLRLTAEGERVASRILAESHARNDAMMADLTAQERRQLFNLVQRVFKTSFAQYGEMKKQAPQIDPEDADDD